MPTRPTRNKTQFASQLDTDLLAAFRDYCRRRGETITVGLERAIRRDMAYPPPAAEPAPLPDAATSAARKPRKVS